MTNRFASLKGWLVDGETLRGRVARGSILLMAGNMGEQAIRFARNIVLTRILAPEVFGVMAVVLMVNSAVESFTEIGIRYAVVQNPRGDKEEYLNAAWFVSFARSLVLYLIGFFLAPQVGHFYENNELVALVRVALLCVIFNGAMSVKAYVALKRLELRKWVIVTHGGGVVGIVVTVFLAVAFRNVWALVIGFTAEAFARFVLSYVITPHMPRLKFEKSSFQELIEFCRGMVGLGFFYFVFIQADVFFVAKMCSAHELGLYAMAVSLANAPVQVASHLVDKVGMSVFSEIQRDKERLNRSLMAATFLIAVLGIPLVALIAIHGKAILGIVYGAPYVTVAVPFAVVVIASFLRLLAAPVAQVYFAVGMPHLHRVFTILRAVVVVALLYPAIHWFGLLGAAVSGLVAMFIGYVFQLLRLRAITRFNLHEFVGRHGKAMIAPLVFSAILLFEVWVFPRQAALNLGIASVLFLSLYAYLGFRHLIQKSE